MKNGLSARFIGAPIQVAYDQPPTLEKRPGSPDGFTWEGRTYRVVAVLQEWHDYRHLSCAAKHRAARQDQGFLRQGARLLSGQGGRAARVVGSGPGLLPRTCPVRPSTGCAPTRGRCSISITTAPPEGLGVAKDPGSCSGRCWRRSHESREGCAAKNTFRSEVIV